MNFRTNWFDLGFYTHHIYEYSSFNFTHLKSNLSDHFDLFLVVISPFRYFFGEYTLLVVQIAFLIVGSFGVFRYTNHILENKQTSLIIQIIFLVSFSVISSLAFDYHSNVIAASLVPFLLLFYLTNQVSKFIFVWLLIVITKENVMFNTSILLICLPLFHKSGGLKKLSLSLGATGLVLFWIIVSKVMPALSNTEVYYNFRYTNVGNSKNFTEMFVYICSHPIETFRLLFTNTTADPLRNYHKIEAHVFIFLSGGFLFFRKPALLLMSVPVYLQKFLHDSHSIWGLSFQYNIDFLPLIMMGITYGVGSKKPIPLVNAYAVYFFLFMNLALTVRFMDNTISYVKRSTVRFYQQEHYKSDIDKAAYEQIQTLIPEKASVCAQSFFTPHLCLRDSIFLFDGNDHRASYILLGDSTIPYPLQGKTFIEAVEKIKLDTNYVLIGSKSNLKLFKRR